MLDGFTDTAPVLDMFSEVDRLKRRIAELPPTLRQALTLMMAANLVEEAAYVNASDGTMPMTTRLMMWAHEIERTAAELGRAA